MAITEPAPGRCGVYPPDGTFQPCNKEAPHTCASCRVSCCEHHTRWSGDRTLCSACAAYIQRTQSAQPVFEPRLDGPKKRV